MRIEQICLPPRTDGSGIRIRSNTGHARWTAARLRIVWKQILLVALLLAGIATVWATGLFDDVTLDGVRRLVEDAGWWGPILLVGLFGLEGLGVVPAFPFLLTAAAIWPPAEALLINMIGALLASLVGFTYARTLGREFIAARLPDRMRRFERRVVERAIPTVIGIRLMFFLAPWAHWALGLSPVSLRAYLIGSSIGYIPWIVAFTFFGAAIVEWGSRQPSEVWIGIGMAVVVSFVAVAAWRALRREPAPKSID
jgi:uncharacterized membrane protein YdjX (TVP38/TMEM64 family)